ncbi:MAG: hypothetical protein N2440_03280 [Actinobacteria bacterium]|nr:hypothetical protein [Actinomycetota bacterium]
MQALEERLEATSEDFETLDDFVEGFASFVEFINKIFFMSQNKKRNEFFGIEKDYFEEHTFLTTSLSFLLGEVKKNPEEFMKTSKKKLNWMWLEIEGEDGLRSAVNISKNLKKREKDLYFDLNNDSRMYMLGFFTCGFFFSNLLNMVNGLIPHSLLEGLYEALKYCYDKLRLVH